MHKNPEQQPHHYVLFSQEERPWPIQNHRAEFALKLIKHGATQAVADATFEATIDPEKVIANLTNRLYASYQELRKKDPEQRDPSLNQLMDHTYRYCLARMQGLQREIARLDPEKHAQLMLLLNQQMEELYWVFNLQEAALAHMSEITNLGMLLALPNALTGTPWRSDTLQESLQPHVGSAEPHQF